MPIDVSQVVKKYAGKWVAYKDDRKTVVASGATAKAALDASKKKGYEHPVLARIPNRVISYVGYSTS